MMRVTHQLALVFNGIISLRMGGVSTASLE